MHNEDNLIRKTILKNNLKESIQVTGKQQYLAGYLSKEKLIKYTHICTHMPELSIQCSAFPHQELANFLADLGAPNPTLCSLDLRKETFFWNARIKWTPPIQQQNMKKNTSDS